MNTILDVARTNDVELLKEFIHVRKVTLDELNFCIIHAAKHGSLDVIKYIFNHINCIDPHYHNDAAMTYAKVFHHEDVQRYLKQQMKRVA